MTYNTRKIIRNMKEKSRQGSNNSVSVCKRWIIMKRLFFKDHPILWENQLFFNFNFLFLFSFFHFYLHFLSSNNPLRNSTNNKIPFFPFIFQKDFFGFILILCLYLLQTHFGISSFSHPDNALRSLWITYSFTYST